MVVSIPILRVKFILFVGFGFVILSCGVSQPERVATALSRLLDVDIYGNLYVLDPSRNLLKLYTRGRQLKNEIGGSGWGNNQFDRPSGIWARNGIDVFVADYGNHRIQRFDRNLNYVATFSTRNDPNPDIRFGYPADVAMSRLGDLFICDTENSRIIKVNRFTQVERTFGGFGGGEGRLMNPREIEIGPGDKVYVVDGGRVLVYDNSGNYLHKLPAVFGPPRGLYGNDAGIIVMDSAFVFCFDEQERLVSSVSLREIGVPEARSYAFTRDSLFILESTDIESTPAPCMIQEPTR